MRSYNRFAMDETIEATIDGASSNVSLYNLSSGGCMIEVGPDGAAKGEMVKLCLPQGVATSGRIVWRIGKNAGIKFDVPLHTNIVERMGYAEEEEFDRNDPRDRFGIPLVDRLHTAAGRLD